VKKWYGNTSVFTIFLITSCTIGVSRVLGVSHAPELLLPARISDPVVGGGKLLSIRNAGYTRDNLRVVVAIALYFTSWVRLICIILCRNGKRRIFALKFQSFDIKRKEAVKKGRKDFDYAQSDD
jgi:hypothetical protein